MGHKKVRLITHTGLSSPQGYLTSELFSNKTRKLLYNLRCKSVTGIRGNFCKQYNDNISCPVLCPQQHEDNQEHILCCQKLVAQLSTSQLRQLE